MKYDIVEFEGIKWIVRPDSVSNIDGNIKDRTGFSTNEAPQMEFLLDRCTKDSIFVDVGAHVGKYALRISPFVKHVIAVEPNVFHFIGLVTNIQINNIKNVSPLNMYLTDSIARSNINYNSAATRVAAGSRYPTIGTSMDNLIDKADMVKIDTEGMELPVLHGMEKILKSKPALSIDTHEHTYGIPNQLEDITRFLEERNYTVEGAYTTMRKDWNIIAW